MGIDPFFSPMDLRLADILYWLGVCRRGLGKTLDYEAYQQALRMKTRLAGFRQR